MNRQGPGEIRARRRPFVVVGVALVRFFSGLCLALPLASLVADSGVGLRAEGDRALFESGGYLLLEIARLHGAALVATARGLVPVLGLGMLLTAICNALLLVALNTREKLSGASWCSTALARLPALCVVAAGCGFAQVALLLTGAIAADAVPEPMTRPVLASLLQVGVWLAVLLAASALGGFADVVKAALVRDEAPLKLALPRAWHCLRQRPLGASFGWLPYGALYVAAALLVAKVVEVLDVSQPGAWRLGVVFALHQLVVLASVAARAAWFAKALRVVATTA